MGVRQLDQDEIADVLRRERVVRIAFNVDGEPYLVPVFYVLCDDGCLRGFSSNGRKARMGAAEGRVAFQVDSSASSGVWEWFSVSGEGTFALIEDDAEVAGYAPKLKAALHDAPSWAPFSKPDLQATAKAVGLLPWRIKPTTIGGRQRTGE
jgi:uncharacterized protein